MSQEIRFPNQALYAFLNRADLTTHEFLQEINDSNPRRVPTGIVELKRTLGGGELTDYMAVTISDYFYRTGTEERYRDLKTSRYWMDLEENRIADRAKEAKERQALKRKNAEAMVMARVENFRFGPPPDLPKHKIVPVDWTKAKLPEWRKEPEDDWEDAKLDRFARRKANAFIYGKINRYNAKIDALEGDLICTWPNCDCDKVRGTEGADSETVSCIGLVN